MSKLSISDGSQIRMARSCLNWSVQELSTETGVSTSTIKRLETPDGFEKGTFANLKLIVTTLERAGIEFIGAPGQGPGVRYWKK